MFHIVFNADENYIKYTAVLINSIVKNTDKNKKFKDFFNNENLETGGGYQNLNYNNLSEKEKTEGYVFHILSDFISDESRAKLKALQSALSAHYPCEIQIHIINAKHFSEQENLLSFRGNYATCFRLLLGRVLPQELKTCLYLDTDMLCVCDVRQIFSIDLKNKIVAVDLIKNNPYSASLKGVEGKADFIYPQDAKHFNSGFMLINLQKWREFNTEAKMLDFCKKYHIDDIPDENTLNAILTEDKRLILPLKFNAFLGVFLKHKWSLALDEAQPGRWILPFTTKELEMGEKEALILHWVWVAKAWDSTLLLNYDKEVELFKYYKLWWDMALQTPIFDKELLLLKTEVQDRFLRDLINQKESEINNRLNAQKVEYETKLAEQRQEYLHSLKEYENKLLSAVNQAKFELLSLLEPRLASAVVRVKNQLSYKLGSAIIKYSKSFSRNLTLPFALFKIYLDHKKEVRIYKERVFYNSNLKLPPLESYADFNEALKVKNHLSYKLGQAFLKGLKTWYKFGLIKFYFEAKRLEREFKAKNKS